MTKTLPTSEANYSCGDIVVVPFPFSGQQAEKRRPSLVVSDARLETLGMVWLVMITSARHSAGASDDLVHDFVRAGLKRPGLVRPTKIAAIEPFRIVRRAGQLAACGTNRVLDIVRPFVATDLTIKGVS